MKRSDLKTGMVVKTRDGWYGVVLIGCDFRFHYGQQNDCILGLDNPASDWMSLTEYTDDLKCIGGEGKFDIVRVYQPYSACAVFQYNDDNCDSIGDCIYKADCD